MGCRKNRATLKKIISAPSTARIVPLVSGPRLAHNLRPHERPHARNPETEKPKLPSTPEEITRKLEDFIKNTLGGQVLFTRVDGPGGRRTQEGDEKSGGGAPGGQWRRPLSSITSPPTSKRTSTAS
jgi:hypothetical protein